MDITKNNAFFEKLKQNVTDTFDRLRKAIDMREKLLLRQLTVVVQQTQHTTFEYDSIRFLGDGEDELVGRIRTFGRYNIDNFNVILQKEPYENEDYILPSNDHDLMHKSCRQGADDERNPESEEIVVEFFNNRSLIKDSAEMVRESIINLTLHESRELIDRTIGVSKSFQGAVEMINEEQPTNEDKEFSLRACKIDPTTHRLHRGRNSLTDIPFDSLSFQGDQQQDDGSNNNLLGGVANGNSKHVRNVSRDGEKVISLSLPSQQRMIPKASQTDGLIVASATDSEGNVREPAICKATIDKRLKNVNRLTMNSCGSTINLKNVTNLTINSCSERPQMKEKTRTISETDPKCPSEEGSPECGFYKRLITENKILRNHILKSKLGGGVGSRFNKSKQPMESSSVSVDRSLSSDSNDETNTNSKQPSNDTGGLSSSSSSSSSTKSSAPPVVRETNLNIPLSEQELQQMFDGVPSSMYEKSLSFVLGELYGLPSGLDGNGVATITSSATGKTKEHTMQIQQWLKQIISEAETEPFQNAEMLEFSKIHD
uniref:Uncharacterized protein n=1 Tax=Anopheles culicifacies TaxID=139723 RepID=A0A182MC60_9DIPT